MQEGKLQEEHKQISDEQFSDIIYCRRHDLKLADSIQKPRLRIKTQYGSSFRPKNMARDFRGKIQRNEKDKKQKSTIVCSYQTEYQTNFSGNNKMLEKLKINISSKQAQNPEHNPFYGLTTYNNAFVNYQGINKYVPIKQSQLRKSLKIKTQTTYNENFSQKYRYNKPFYVKENTKSHDNKAKREIQDKISKNFTKSSYSLNFDTHPIQDRKEKQRGKYHNYNTILAFQYPVQIKPTKISTISTQKSKTMVNSSPSIKKAPLRIYKKKQLQSLKQKLKNDMI